MGKTIFIIRIFFLLLCLLGAYLLWSVAEGAEAPNGEVIEDPDQSPTRYLLIGGLLGVFTILVDIFLKGFSLRGLTAVSFGLFIGLVVSYMLSVSPLFETGDEQTKYLARLSLFVVCTYLATVITLRGKDEFNLVIPYMRFVPQKVNLPMVVVDTSALIDGRIAGICATGFLNADLIIPRFVIDELQRVADSNDPEKRARGRKGLKVLNELRKSESAHVNLHESEVDKRSQIESKLIYLAQSVNGKLLTADYNLAKLAEFQGVPWLNLNALSRVLREEVSVGEKFDVDLVKPGRDEGQAVGYLSDGSMVVVNDASENLGETVYAEVISVVPSAAGKMVFARLAK